MFTFIRGFYRKPCFQHMHDEKINTDNKYYLNKYHGFIDY